MKKTIIEVRNLKKDFYLEEITVHALRGINLEIKEGEFVAIMGTSGSGKSTMLNVSFWVAWINPLPGHTIWMV